MAEKSVKATYLRLYAAASQGKKVTIQKDEYAAFVTAVQGTAKAVDDDDLRAQHKFLAAEVALLVRKGDLRLIEPRVFEDAQGKEYTAYEPVEA